MIERMDDFPDPLLPINSTFLFFFRASILSDVLGVAVELQMPRSCGGNSGRSGEQLSAFTGSLKCNGIGFRLEVQYKHVFALTMGLRAREHKIRREGDELQPSNAETEQFCPEHVTLG